MQAPYAVQLNLKDHYTPTHVAFKHTGLTGVDDTETLTTALECGVREHLDRTPPEGRGRLSTQGL